MIARAPGKVVLSGAYAVLEGAPAIVAAVDRYAVADASRPGLWITAEVQAAIDAGDLRAAPWFDASALRAVDASGRSRKLGLGSSAAILVASLASVHGAENVASLAERGTFAHRTAQGGGSGVDVAASAWGGVLVCRLRPDASGAASLASAAHELPAGVVVEIFASQMAADTPDLLARVRAHAARDLAGHRRILDEAGEAARAAVGAPSPAELVSAISAQVDALAALGRSAGAPIVTDDVAGLRAAARAEGASFGPSGAGGGDIAIFVGGASSSIEFRARARGRGLELLDASIGARGVHVFG